MEPHLSKRARLSWSQMGLGLSHKNWTEHEPAMFSSCCLRAMYRAAHYCIILDGSVMSAKAPLLSQVGTTYNDLQQSYVPAR